MKNQTISIQLDLDNAKSVHLDTIYDDGTATLYVEYQSGSAAYRITLKELQSMANTASFSWCGLNEKKRDIK